MGGKADLDDSSSNNHSIPSCIVCQNSDNHEQMGFLAFSQASKLFNRKRRAVHKDETAVDEENNQVSINVSFCGHAMHYGCFDSFFATVIQRSEMQSSLITDTNKGQYQCKEAE